MLEGRQRLMPAGHWNWTIPVPFSQGWRVGNLVFVGGQISADEHGRTIGVGDIETQTRNVFENIRKVLAECGATMQDIVKFNTFYVYDGPEEGTDQYWKDMTDVRLEFLGVTQPAGTFVVSPALAWPGMMIEIDATASTAK